GWHAYPATARQARDLGTLDEAAPSEAAALEGADVVVLAMPVEATVATLERWSKRPLAAGLILDTASVKVAVARAGQALAAFVGTHPVAGSERSGPAAGRADLFEGRAWAYDGDRAPDAVSAARRFIAELGARPFAIDPATHDRLIALTSHLPQVVAVALACRLAERLDEAGVYDLCGPGIRSTARLAASSWDMWEGILAVNATTIAQEVRATAAILTEVAGSLEGGDMQSLRQRFSRAAGAVERLA
ncbi:MAG: prephenate dehydrogenase/arogenate dehydrogenase family protein, partial [Candidatus Eremiobacteraeota bacterium]|nr:prephenate dehydrogenase/arogenate dehydrogenase family protein [Candidatus Eremiobacteraeota bacterium]